MADDVSTRSASGTTTGLAPRRTTGFHHVAYACRDGEETRSFYEDLLGMPLVHTEVKRQGDSWFRHLFFDTGDGSCIAFFEVHGVGERPDWRSEISVGAGLPVWVNHVAFGADEARVAEVRARMDAAGVAPLMELDHGWCVSLYYVDPNGIMVELCRDTEGFAVDPDEARARLTSTDDTDATREIIPFDPAGLRGHPALP
ncbi:MAG: VOC family protein [Actinomyces sp.]|nr:MAG: VOC family protein [Actinomyces sp.]